MEQLDPSQYNVAWIAPLEIEAKAALKMLDHRHSGNFPMSRGRDYLFYAGDIAGHNVIIATFPPGDEYGTASAAALAGQVKMFFPNLWFGLLVGAAAGLPNLDRSPPRDIRLGDVLVALPDGDSAGLVSYELGKETVDGFQILRCGHVLATTERLVRAAIGRIKIEAPYETHMFLPFYNAIKDQEHAMGTFVDPGQQNDRFYRIDDEGYYRVVERPFRDPDRRNQVWYGPIGSGNKLMKNSKARDELRDKYDIIGLEMEAAGTINHIPVGVIRGVCDYGDEHKNKEWQPYAAAMAAAYSKAVMHQISPNKNISFEANRKELMDSLRWLSAPDPSLNYREAISLRLQNTGNWFLTSPVYSKWKSTPGEILWLFGIPGCGKTILSSTIIQDLLSQTSRTRSRALYYFFTFSDSGKQDLGGLLRSLMSQTLENCKTVPEAMHTLKRKCKDGKRSASSEELVEVFTGIIRDLKDVYLVLDALDECNNRGITIGFLEKLKSFSQNLHILVTSRKERDIEIFMSSFTTEDQHVGFHDINVNEDIRRYIQDRWGKDKNLGKWKRRPDIQNEVENFLMENAQGMFRWAVCQLDEITKCINILQLRRTLRNLPKTLDATYERILLNIEEDYQDYALRILRWLAFSERPLTLDEVAEVVAFSANDSHFEETEILEDPQDVILVCSSLVSIEKKNVRLAHYSVKEYLVSDRILTSKASLYSLQQGPSNILLTQECLIYLLRFVKLAIMTEDIVKKFKLAKYAARYWVNHTIKISKEDQRHLEDIARSFFSAEKTAFLASIRIYNPISPQKGLDLTLTHSQIESPLYYVAMAGLLSFVRLLLKDLKVDVNENRLYRRALSIASMKGHLDVVEELLNSGADPNLASSYSNATALREASSRGYTNIIERLLNAGADPNLIFRYGNETAPQEASSRGSTNIVERPLNPEANPNLTSGYVYGTALQEALSGGYLDIVELLLNAGADPNLISGDVHVTALQGASSGGYTNIVERLLNAGADPNLISGYIYGTALQEASSRGYLDIVELLLGAGAILDLRDENGKTAKALALEAGHFAVVKRLERAREEAKMSQNNNGSALREGLIGEEFPSSTPASPNDCS